MDGKSGCEIELNGPAAASRALWAGRDKPWPSGSTLAGDSANGSRLMLVAWFLPGALLFLLMVIAPTAWVPAKTLLLAWCICVVMLTRWFEGVPLRAETLVMCAWMVTVGFLIGIHGMLQGTPGWAACMRVFVMWPLVFSLLVGGLNQLETCRTLIYVLWTGMIFVGVHNLIFVLVQGGFLPAWTYLQIGDVARSGFYDGYVQVSTLSINGVPFMAPFLIAAAMYWPTLREPPVRLPWLLLGLTLLCAIALLSGRRGIWAVCLAALPVAMALGIAGLGRDFHRLIRWRAVLAAAITLVVLTVGYHFLSNGLELSLASIKAELSSASDFDGDASNQVRIEQFRRLIDGWMEQPLVGAGLGAGVWGHQRDVAQPWAFELSYVALLYHAGLLGFGCYVLGVAWIYLRGIQAMRLDSELAPLVFPVLVGMTCFLAVNATNPYLTKFDFMWVLFLPITLVETFLQRRAGGQIRPRYR